MLEIQIRNVGKIKEACIELPGITVIAGLNGTGKSTNCEERICSRKCPEKYCRGRFGMIKDSL